MTQTADNEQKLKQNQTNRKKTQLKCTKTMGKKGRQAASTTEAAAAVAVATATLAAAKKKVRTKCNEIE